MEPLKRFALKAFKQVRLVGEGEPRLINPEEAYQLAESQGLDLCLLQEGEIPVVKVLDYQKHIYEERKSKKKTAKTSLKEMQFRINISDHDLETKLRKVREFLDEGNKVKILVKIRGREPPDLAAKLTEKILKLVACSKYSRIQGGAILEK